MQQKIVFNGNNGSINISNRPAAPPQESKDEILKTRFEPTTAETIKAFCRGRRITVSDYFRTLSHLDFDFYDHISTLNKKEVREIIIPLLEVLSKKF